MKKILVTGSNGQLGRALHQLLQNSDADVTYTTSKDLDIRDEKAVHAFVQTCNPDLIINAAAHTAVDLCESDRENAYAINANGPKYLAMAAKEIDAELVHVSTDYVFDGTSSRPYLETDTPCPQSVYGSSKLAGEKNVMESMEKYYIVRTAWLYGDGKNFVRTMLRLAKDHDMRTVVNDQFGSPTSALELARMILYIIDKKDYGIYHATCEGITSWYDFAREIFKQASVSIQVKPVSTEEYPAAIAKRPAYSVLENAHLHALGDYRMKDWKDALKEYMAGNEPIKASE